MMTKNIPILSTISTSLLLRLLVVAPPRSAAGLDVDVLTCLDLRNVNAALVQDHVTARVASNLVCEEWTTIVVHEDEERQLRIESLLPADQEELPLLTLESVRFDVGRGAAVTFAADVRIMGSAYGQMQGGAQGGTNGGAMDVHDSASVTFLGDLGLENIKVPGSGAGMHISNNAVVEVHGRATFNGLFSAENGGAVCTMAGGTLVVYGGVTGTNNDATNNGGVFYNLGHIRVEGQESEFRFNSAVVGASLYNGRGAGGLMFFSAATFENNHGVRSYFRDGVKSFTTAGEHIYSKSYVFFGAGATFVDGPTAIHVAGGLVDIEGPSHFSGFTTGAVYVTYEPLFANLKLEEPPTFKNNSAGGVGNNCVSIAYEQLDGSFKCATQ